MGQCQVLFTSVIISVLILSSLNIRFFHSTWIKCRRKIDLDFFKLYKRGQLFTQRLEADATFPYFQRIQAFSISSLLIDSNNSTYRSRLMVSASKIMDLHGKITKIHLHLYVFIIIRSMIYTHISQIFYTDFSHIFLNNFFQ